MGLQRDRARAMELCLALLLHKGILAVSLSLRLLQSHLRAQVVAGCGILFSCMTPLGIGLGAALAESAGPLHQLAQSVLEGMAAGTFLYITFLEILPQELAASEQRILKVILLLRRLCPAHWPTLHPSLRAPGALPQGKQERGREVLRIQGFSGR